MSTAAAVSALGTIEPTQFRSVMRHLPTGVAAICATDPATGRPCGLIVGTFASLSLEPALVTFSVARTSSSWPKVARSGRFSVNLLADGQQSVCQALSRKEEDKFRLLDWEWSPHGTPHLRGALGRLDCTVMQEVDGGDHTLIIATVQDLAATGSGDPLVFHGGRLGSFRETAAA